MRKAYAPPPAYAFVRTGHITIRYMMRKKPVVAGHKHKQFLSFPGCAKCFFRMPIKRRGLRISQLLKRRYRPDIDAEANQQKNYGNNDPEISIVDEPQVERVDRVDDCPIDQLSIITLSRVFITPDMARDNTAIISYHMGITFLSTVRWFKLSSVTKYPAFGRRAAIGATPGDPSHKA